MSNQTDISFPILLTDCSAPGVRAGILGPKDWLAYERSSGETAAALFQAVENVLHSTSLSLSDIRGFVFCEGPGSTLGIRINAMALRTWISLGEEARPAYAFRSLEAAALLIRERESQDLGFAVFSDLRKNAWNACRSEPGAPVSDILVVAGEELGDWPSKRFYVQQRLYSPGMPDGAELLDYDLEPLGSSTAFRRAFRPVESPSVFQTTTTEFKQWSPQRHR